MKLPRLIVLTDRSQLRLGRGLVRTVAECVQAGLTHVVVREHDLPALARSALIGSLVGVPGLTVISSRIPDPAAHGLHEPADAPDLDEVGIRGRSCHTSQEVRRAAADGLDYATLSPYAPTSSKPGYGPALPSTAYADHALPVFALGGITPSNAHAARESGAHGVAVMGAVMRSADPAETVARLLEVTR